MNRFRQYGIDSRRKNLGEWTRRSLFISRSRNMRLEAYLQEIRAIEMVTHGWRSLGGVRLGNRAK